MSVDLDLTEMSKEELISEVRKLRQAIREHRDCSGHDLCWYHPELWDLLPESERPNFQVPEWPEFMAGCIKFRRSLDTQAPEAARVKKTFKEE